MRKRKISITVLLAFLSWTPSAKGVSFTGAETVSSTEVTFNLQNDSNPLLVNAAVSVDHGIDITISGLSGSLTATGVSPNGAAGLLGTNINIGSASSLNGVSGTVIATASAATRQKAFGIASEIDTIIYGNLSGSVTATALGTYSEADALGAQRDIIINGDLSGTLTAKADSTASWATGLIALNDITVTNLSGKVSATAGEKGNAYGLEASNSDQANANADITITDFSGKVNATAGLYSTVAGFRAFNGRISISKLRGEISAISGNYSSSYGMDGFNGLSIGDLSGSVNATAGNGSNVNPYGYAYAYGLAASSTKAAADIIIENLSATGIVNATVGNLGRAYGMLAENNINIRNLSGTVTATAGDGDSINNNLYTGAAGLYANKSIDITNLSGTVSATAGNYAVAIGVLSPKITIANITGTVSATAKPYGIAYAIWSGDESQANISGNDNITVSSGGKLIGIVALNAGDDTFTLKGNADISGVPSLDGGNGNDALVLDGWTGSFAGVTLTGWESTSITGSTHLTGEVTIPKNTPLALTGATDLSGVTKLDGGGVGSTSQLTFNDSNISLSGVAVSNFASIALADGATVNIGSATDSLNPKTITFTNGLTIDGTSTLQTAGSSPGYYDLVGDITNNGTIRLLDHLDAQDRLTITGNYTGTGAITFDVNTSTLASDQVVITGNASGSTKLVVTELGVPTNPTIPIRLVSVEGTKGVGAFTAGEFIYPYGPKLYNYTLTQDGNDYYLSALTFDRYREEAALLQGVTPFVEQLGFESVTGFRERHAYNSFPGGEHEPAAFWARAYGSSYAIGQQGDAATSVKGYSGGTQVGGDFSAGGTGSASQYHVGVYTGTGWQKADVGGVITEKAGEITQNVYNVGLYASIEQNKGYFLEGVLQSGYHIVDITSPDETGTIKANTWSFVGSLEGGVNVPVSGSFTLEPQAQLIYQHIGSMNISTVIGDVTINSHEGLRTRLGLNGTFTNVGVPFNPFFELNLLKDFTNDSQVTYAADSSVLKSKPETTQFGGSIGIASAKNKKETISYYAKVGALYGIDGGRNSYDYTLIAGISKAF
jgi:outer membrane autotransporter protein